MNKNLSRMLGIVLGAVMLVTTSAASAVVIEQPLKMPDPDGLDSYLDDIGAGVESADSFTVTTPMFVETISWWGVYGIFPEPANDDFLVRVFADAAGEPGALLYEGANLAVSRSATGLVDVFFADIFEYSYDLPAADVFALPNGAYWLSVVNVSNVAPDFADWYWSESEAADGVNAYREPLFDPVWIIDDPSIDFAYRITGSAQSVGEVPVAPTWLLLLLTMPLLLRRNRAANLRMGSDQTSL